MELQDCRRQLNDAANVTSGFPAEVDMLPSPESTVSTELCENPRELPLDGGWTRAELGTGRVKGLQVPGINPPGAA